MACPHTLDVSNFYDGELPASKEKSLHEHLATCPECWDFLEWCWTLEQLWRARMH